MAVRDGIEVVGGNVRLKVAGTTIAALTTGGINVASGKTILIGSAAVATGTQSSKISDPSGGGTQDAEARTAINAIIDALEAFGISATS